MPPIRAAFQLVAKVCFFKKSACSQSLSPNPFPRERGYITGATAPDQARMLAVSHTKPLHDAVAQMADDLYGGYAPKQGCFGCLPKVLHDAKPTEQAISDTHFYIIKRFIDSLMPPIRAAFQLVAKVCLFIK